MSDPVHIRFRRKGHGNPNCFLSQAKGCSEKISREHYISASLLDQIARNKATVDISGLSWMKPGETISVGKARLTAKILCIAHNSALSGLDAEIAKLANAIYSIDQTLQSETPQEYSYRMDGNHIERWLLKTLVGMIESKQMKWTESEPYRYKEKCVKLLCNSQARWPRAWGLYVAQPTDYTYHSSSFELAPMYNPQDGSVLGIALKINGFRMTFVMGTPNEPGQIGLRRPKQLLFRGKGKICRIRFTWGRDTGRGFIRFDQAGTYKGPPPT